MASDLPSAGASVNGPSRTPDILQPSSILCKTPGETDRISSSFQAPPKPLPFSSVPAFHNKNNLSVSNKSHRETEECQSQVITSAGAISNESESGLLSRSGINTSSKATPSIHLTMNSSGSSSRSVKRTPTSGTSLLLERSSFCPSVSISISTNILTLTPLSTTIVDFNLFLTLVLLGPYIYGFKHVLRQLNLIKSVFCTCLVDPILQYWRCLFFINKNVFHFSSFQAGNCLSNSSFKSMKNRNSYFFILRPNIYKS